MIKQLIKIEASWCVPCKQLTKLLDTMKDDLVECHITPLDIDLNREQAKQYGIKSVPTIILLDASGVEIKRHVGIMTKEGVLDFIA